MRLTLKIFIPLFLCLVVVLIFTNVQVVKMFQNIFLENKALSLGEHAIKEAKDLFTDDDLHKKNIDETFRIKIKQFTKKIEEPSIFRVKVWDENPRIVYSDFAKLIGTTNVKGADFVKQSFTDSTPVRWIADKENENEAEFGEFLKVAVPLKDSKGDTQYVLEMYVATSAVLANIQSTINQVIYLWIGSGVVIYSLFYLLVNIILIRPIRMLEKAVGSVSKGDFTNKITIHSNDEIGDFYKSFTIMRIQLSNVIFQLETSKKELQSNNEVLAKQRKQLEDKLEDLEKFQELTIRREFKMIELKEALAKAEEEIEKLKKTGYSV